jgi:hypothetical protein
MVENEEAYVRHLFAQPGTATFSLVTAPRIDSFLLTVSIKGAPAFKKRYRADFFFSELGVRLTN